MQCRQESHVFCTAHLKGRAALARAMLWLCNRMDGRGTGVESGAGGGVKGVKVKRTRRASKQRGADVAGTAPKEKTQCMVYIKQTGEGRMEED